MTLCCPNQWRAQKYNQVIVLMWEKLRIRERDRMWGFLFLSAFLAFVTFSLLAMGFPQAAMFVGIAFLLASSVMLTRIIRIWLQIRSARAPVGPLSSDERIKARSKLLKPRRQLAPPNKSSALAMPFY